MPFKSEKQRRYLHANHPKIAKRWEKDYANGGITLPKGPAGITSLNGWGSKDESQNIAGADISASMDKNPNDPGWGGGGGGGGPPSIVHAPKGPTAAEIAAAKAKAEAEKRRLEEAAMKKNLTDFKTTQKKKVKHKSNIKPFGFTEYEKLIKPGLYDHYKKSLPSYDSEGLDFQTDRVLDNLHLLTDIRKGGLQGNIEKTVSPFGQTFQDLSSFDYVYDPYKPTQENLMAEENTLITPVATFNTMEDLKNITGATKEKMFSSDHKLTSEGKNLGKFIESSKKLHGSQNPITGGGTIENIKSWMIDNKRRNIYKDYLNESGTDFNETIKDAINKGLFEKKEDFTQQVDILEVKDGGPIRKKYSTGSNGVLDIDGSEEITTEEGNDISLVDENETGVSTLFRAKNGGYAVQGGVKNYLGEQEMVHAPKHWQSAPDHPKTELTYITKPEKDLLVKADLHGSLHGSVNKGPQGLTSLNGWGDADDGFGSSGNTNTGGGNNDRPTMADVAGPTTTTTSTPDTGGHSRFDVGSGYYGEPVTGTTENISGGDIWDWDDTSDRDDVLDQKQDIVNRAIIFMRDKYPKSTNYAKDPSLWSEISSIPTSPIGVLTAIGKDIYNTKQLKDLMKEIEDAGLVGGPPGTNPQIYDEMWMHLENRKRKKDDEDKDDDGPEVPVVAPVTEEIEDSYAMARDWLQGYRDLKAKQALSASLQEKWADERQWQQETMFANSGGLANLFRVKNY